MIYPDHMCSNLSPFIYCRFAFLEFSSAQEVDTMIEEKQGSELGGMALLCDHTGSKSKKQKFDGGRQGGHGGKSSAGKSKQKSVGGKVTSRQMVVIVGGKVSFPNY